MNIENREGHVSLLGEAIGRSDKSFLTRHKPNQRINVLGKDNVYFLKNGNLTVCTNNGSFVIFNSFSPDIIGLELLSDVILSHHIRCISKVEFYVIKKDDLVELLDRENLWSSAFHIISQFLYIYHVRDLLIHQPTIKDTITHYLRYIWSFNKTRRDKISIYSFISSRTYLARSSIHKVIANLESAGEISTNRGILLECKLAPFSLIEEYVHKGEGTESSHA